jgi:DNA end-binding protein Ku
MHFPDEILDPAEFASPTVRAVGKAELNMAKRLIESMSGKWDPAAYHDDYRETLEKVIEEKMKKGGERKAVPAQKRTRPGNVIDLVSVLQESIRETQKKPGRKAAPQRKTA